MGWHIKEVGYKHIQKLRRTQLLFQNDADTKQRTKRVLETINELFIDKILPEEGDGKFADVWSIEKVRGEQLLNFEQLKTRVNKISLKNSVM